VGVSFTAAKSKPFLFIFFLEKIGPPLSAYFPFFHVGNKAPFPLRQSPQEQPFSVCVFFSLVSLFFLWTALSYFFLSFSSLVLSFQSSSVVLLLPFPPSCRSGSANAPLSGAYSPSPPLAQHKSHVFFLAVEHSSVANGLLSPRLVLGSRSSSISSLFFRKGRSPSSVVFPPPHGEIFPNGKAQCWAPIFPSYRFSPGANLAFPSPIFPPRTDLALFSCVGQATSHIEEVILFLSLGEGCSYFAFLQ